MKKEKIAWDFWHDKQQAKLWITILVLVAITTSAAITAFILATILIYSESPLQSLETALISILIVGICLSIAILTINLIRNAKINKEIELLKNKIIFKEIKINEEI